MVDPRSLPGCPLTEIVASKVGVAFLMAAGDPIPQVGEKEVLICIESVDIRSVKARCSTVAIPLVSVKRMTEAGQFFDSCSEGEFAQNPRRITMTRAMEKVKARSE